MPDGARGPGEALLTAAHDYGFAPARHPLELVPRRVAKAVFLSGLVARHAGRRTPAALARFWEWQVRRRLHRGTVVMDFGSFTLSVPPWSEMGGMLAALGSHEPKETRFFDRLLRPGDRFVDVGANIGYYSHRAAVAGAEVTAFEPGDAARSAMHASLARSGLSGRVTILACALSDTDGEGFLSAGDTTRRLGDGGPESTLVALRRLDGIAAEHGLADPRPGGLTVLKIDAEGHDLAVLRGAAGVLDGARPVVMVETWPGEPEVREALEAHGYTCFRLATDGSPTPWPPGWTGQENLVAVAPGDPQDIVRQRLAERPVAPLGPPRVLAWR